MTSHPQQKGALIVFEGIDGTGKSTQISLLAEYLQSRKVKTVSGFEPTQGQWGKRLRESMVSGRLSQEEEIDLFLRDRRDNVENFILPHLKDGFFVLLDRYYFSMMAYQGARGCDPAQLRRMNEEFAPRPALVVWLDIPVETALARVGSRGSANEFEKADQLQKCREIFAAVNEPWFIRIDASGAPGEVAEAVRKTVDSHFPL